MTHGDYYSVDNAGFLISQTQSGAAVTVRVRAFDETTPTVMEADKVADLTDDPVDMIDLIKVVNAAGATLFLGNSGTQNGITVALAADGAGNHADVSGLRAGMKVIVSTADGGYHRLVAENVGRKGFDLGGVVLEQATPPEPVTMSFPLTVKDGDLDAASGSIGVTLNPPSPMTAASAGTGSAAPLTRGQVRAIRAEAFRRWNLTGLTGAERKLLQRVRFQIADLDGLTLGTTIGQTIILDRDAAANGWFVDRTPRTDLEFTTPGDQGEQGRIDLLTVVMHEMGHVLGHGHDDGGVMADTLDTGVRLNVVAPL
jgi:hypothetical protein